MHAHPSADIITWLITGNKLLYIFYGADEFSQREELAKLCREFASQQLGDLNTTKLDGARLSLDQLRTACNVVPFFAEKRVIVINGLLARFEPKQPREDGGHGAGRRASKSGLDKEDLAQLLLSLPDPIVVVTLDGQIRASANPLLKLLESAASVRAFQVPAGHALVRWILARFEEKGGKASRGAAERLASLVGPDLRVLDSEVEKLTVYAAGREVQRSDVDQLVPEAHQDTVFDLINALLRGEQGQALSLLRDLLGTGAAATQLLFMITRQFRHLLLAKDSTGAGRVGLTAAQRSAGLNEWGLSRCRELARRYTWSQLEGVYERLLEVDVASKTGRIDPAIALELLTVELCMRAK